MSHDKILILDFGSQVTQLIARRVREAHVFCEVHPCDMPDEWIREYARDQALTILREFTDVETARQAGRGGFGEMLTTHFDEGFVGSLHDALAADVDP